MPRHEPEVQMNEVAEMLSRVFNGNADQTVEDYVKGTREEYPFTDKLFHDLKEFVQNECEFLRSQGVKNPMPTALEHLVADQVSFLVSTFAHKADVGGVVFIAAHFTALFELMMEQLVVLTVNAKTKG